jgi:hypothetical protein
MGFHDPQTKRESYFFWVNYGFSCRVETMKMRAHNNLAFAALFKSKGKQTFVFNLYLEEHVVRSTL